MNQSLSHDARALCPDIGDRLQAQFHELAIRPTPDGAERLAIQLEGARRHLLSMRAQLLHAGRVADTESAASKKVA